MAISASTTYELLPLEDVTLAADVASNSTANFANVRLWDRNGGNAQKWLFAAEGTDDVWYIKDAETGKCLDVRGAVDADRTNVSMYTANQTVAQKWKAEYVGTQEVNGYAYETYQFVAFGGTTDSPRCLDVQGDGAYIRSNLWIYRKVAGHPSQTFVLVPTEWNAWGGTTSNNQPVIAVPSAGECGLAVGTAEASVCAAETGTVYPAWKCAESAYQLRYRTRSRVAGKDGIPWWGEWLSISDGSNQYDGWGAPGASNCTPTLTSGRRWSPNGVAVDNSSTYDRTDVQFSCRGWRPEWGVGSTASAHGAAYAWSITTVRPIAVTALTATYSPDGLRIGWVTDSTRGNMDVTLISDLFVSTSGTFAATDYATIPVDKLTEIPADGSTYRVYIVMNTEDGLSMRLTRDVTVTYTGGTEALTLTSETVGTLATVTASDPTASAWLLIPRGHGNRIIPLDGTSPWTVPAPLGVDWSVYAVAGNDTTWGATLTTFGPIPVRGYHVTSQDLATDVQIDYGLDEPVAFSPKYQRSNSSVDTYGRERPVYTVGNVTAADWTIEGVIKDGEDGFDWLAHAGHVYFRGPRGFWAQSLVTDAEIDLSRSKLSKVSASFVEEVW